MSEKNYSTSPHTKITQPLLTQNHATSQQNKNQATCPLKNIARIAKRCPENITLVVKCVKLHFPKVLRKLTYLFLFFTVVTAVTVVTVVRTIMQPLHTKSHNLSFFFYFFIFFGKSNLTHLTADVMFSGQRFAILAMFLNYYLKKTHQSPQWYLTDV